MESKSSLTFRGPTAIVTGASQGIGETIALGLAREGLSLALVDILKDKLEAVAEKIRQTGGRASTHPADVSRFVAARKE